MARQPTWLETERQEGVARKAGRAALRVSGAGVRVSIVPWRREAARGAESKAAPREGRQEGGWVRAIPEQTKRREYPKGLDKAQRPRSETMVSGSFAVEGAHAGGAGNGVIKGILANVFFAAQGLFTLAILCQRANPDEEPHRLESRVRENRTHGSEGGDGASRSRPLSGQSGSGPRTKTFRGDGMGGVRMIGLRYPAACCGVVQSLHANPGVWPE